MNERQARFVDAYIRDPCAAKAAIEAGYSEKTAKVIGQENLTKPDLQSAIRERNAQLETGRIADLEECLSLLTQIIRGELTTERKQVTKDGVVTYMVKPTIAERTKAMEVRLKTLGAFLVPPTDNGGGALIVRWADSLDDVQPVAIGAVSVSVSSSDDEDF